MHKSVVTLRRSFRNSCVYEFVKLCLRYTARDPRLRSDVWSENSRNNCGELTGGHIKSIFKLILADAQRKLIQTGFACVIVSQRVKDIVEIQHLYNRKELSFY